MNMRHQEESRTASTTDKEPSKDPKRLAVQPPSSAAGAVAGSKSRGDQGGPREVLRIGGDGTPVSPSSGGNRQGVRRTGSTTANNIDAKAVDPSQQATADNLSVAGSGVGPRSASSQQLAKGPSFRGPSNGSVDQPQVRGDRVRGPAFNRRVPSEKVCKRKISIYFIFYISYFVYFCVLVLVVYLTLFIALLYFFGVF